MSTDTIDAEYEIETTEGGALAVLQSAEIDIQISTAKRYPRSVTAFKREALEMATIDERTAGMMFYRLPRGGRFIEGPSVRLAEIAACCWGNLRYASRVISVEDKFVVAQGICFDLQRNTSASIEVRRRINPKKGKPIDDDDRQLTAQSACSIALRNAIIKVIPRAYVDEICNQARQVAIGNAETMEDKRHKVLEWFGKTGATEKMILDFLEKKGMEDVTVDDLITLRGIATAIKDGEITVEAALAPQGADVAAGSKVSKSDLGEKLARNKNGKGGKKSESDEGSQDLPLATGEIAADLSRFHDVCLSATMIGEVTKADAELRGPNGRTLSDDEAVLADAWKAEAETRIRNGRGERTNKQEQKSLTD